MRDAQSKLDQVIAFTGTTIAPEDVATVLGLVGRDLLLDTLEAVADEDAPAAFALAGRAVEMGYDLRAVVRELSRVVRDLLVVSVDPTRIGDPEIAAEGERDRLKGLAGRFSREDLLRAFDLLTRAEAEVRAAAQPRYHLEMALLRWIYLRKLVPIEDLIAGTAKPSGVITAARPAIAAPPAPGASPARPAAPPPPTAKPAPAAAESNLKDALLAEIRKSKVVFYNTVVAQAQKIEVTADSVTFTFSPRQRALSDEFGKNRAWLESIVQQIAGRKIAVACVQAGAADAPETPGSAPAAPADAAASKKSALREKAMADAGVQALLEVFPAEIRDVEEM
jgi:DNA polymerase-3 subunit gamma/tau